MGRTELLLVLAAAVGCGSKSSDNPAAASASASALAPVATVVSAPPPPAASASQPPTAAKADPSLLAVEGKAVQGAVLRAKVTGRVKHISFLGHKTTILEDGEFLIGFSRNALPKEKLALTLDDGSVVEREFDVEQRSYEPDKID